MSFWQELNSWLSPPKINVSHQINPGSTAPSSDRLQLPCGDGKPAVITFLRHCGCPYEFPDVHFIAVSHSDESSTEKWLKDVGGAGKVGIIVDSKRDIYGKWGLGPSSFGHVLSPTGLFAVYKVGKEQNIWNRPTESGNRWQTSGSWAVNGHGLVVWGGSSSSADDVPDFPSVTEKILALSN